MPPILGDHFITVARAEYPQEFNKGLRKKGN
jgi:hypothetical protein